MNFYDNYDIGNSLTASVWPLLIRRDNAWAVWSGEISPTLRKSCPKKHEFSVCYVPKI